VPAVTESASSAAAAAVRTGEAAHPGIGDYALIGDCRSAALVSRDGSLDWLCFPRFDSPSVFAALLDPEGGGRFRVRPAGRFRSSRRYLPGTNILETTFHAPSGSFVLRDLMPVSSETAKRRGLRPQHQVLREVEGRTGEIEIEVVYQPRPGYATRPTRITDHGGHGLQCDAGPGLLLLRSEIPLTLTPDATTAAATVRIRAGERYYLALAYEEDAPATLPLLGPWARRQVDESAAWWRDWIGGCAYRGPYRDAVSRSALTLKLLTFAPSGAIVAAPTTSLPEKLGGERNWDYRYCWLRDASFTVDALLSLGFDAEAEAFFDWMLHATRLSWPALQVVYNVYGETRLPERQLAHLPGFAGSSPVRIGNDAHDQLQLDVYGEVVHAAAQFAARGRWFDRDTTRLLNALGETVCQRWREADEGLWEGRSGRFHHTHSRVLCWAALDRLLAMHDAGLLEADVPRFRAERDALRAEIEGQGYNDDLGSYTGTLGGNELDASLLTLPLYGYVDAASPRMRSTLARIRKGLGVDGLLYRYDVSTADGLTPGEGAFGICSFWAVECLARAGEVEEAAAAFERLLAYQNDVGLFAEEIDPESGAALGNFPQAFTHVGLINAALAIERAKPAGALE
jgi:GH15 family glucan-1,4-alpha-glucosidase